MSFRAASARGADPHWKPPQVLSRRRPPSPPPSYPAYCAVDGLNLDTFRQRHHCLRFHPQAIVWGYFKSGGRLQREEFGSCPSKS